MSSAVVVLVPFDTQEIAESTRGRRPRILSKAWGIILQFTGCRAARFRTSGWSALWSVLGGLLSGLYETAADLCDGFKAVAVSAACSTLTRHSFKPSQTEWTSINKYPLPKLIPERQIPKLNPRPHDQGSTKQLAGITSTQTHAQASEARE